MNVRTVVISAVLAASAPVAAQQATFGAVDPLRAQLLTYEDLLRRAIEVAGADVSKQVEQRAPRPIMLILDPAPVVRGWPIEGFGYHFDVQVPDMAESAVLVWQMQMLSTPPELRPSARPTPSQPVANSSRPSATGGGAVEPDPMVGSPSAVTSTATFDPVAAYRDNVRMALIDAILNNPGALTLRDADTLAVSAAGVGQSAVYRLRPTSRRLTLYIRGADLRALREGTITREEAKRRISERYF